MKKEEEDGRDAVADGRRVDYLTPFLANVKDPNNLTKDEGRHVRDACLKALKERCVVRWIESMVAILREGGGIVRSNVVFGNVDAHGLVRGLAVCDAGCWSARTSSRRG